LPFESLNEKDHDEIGLFTYGKEKEGCDGGSIPSFAVRGESFHLNDRAYDESREVNRGEGDGRARPAPGGTKGRFFGDFSPLYK
jgi:hypothetical protein